MLYQLGVLLNQLRNLVHKLWCLLRDLMRMLNQLRNLLKRLEERKIKVELSDAAKSFLVAEGYDPMYGARPLKRTIQRLVLDPLAGWFCSTPCAQQYGVRFRVQPSATPPGGARRAR